MILKKKFNNLLILLTITASTGEETQPTVTIYAGPNETGRSWTTSAAIDDMADAGFTVYSVCVGRGTFIFYDGKNFNPGGDGSSKPIYGEEVCQNVDPETTLSVRPAGNTEDYTISSLTFYTHKGFQGQDLVISGSTPNVGFKGDSVIITGSDPWMLYTEPDYAGIGVCLQQPSVNVPVLVDYLGNVYDGLPKTVIDGIGSVQKGCKVDGGNQLKSI